MATLTVTNGTAQDADVTVRDGRGREVIRATSDPLFMPAGAPQTYHTGTALTGTSSYDTAIEDQIARTGRFPEGDYTLCVSVTDGAGLMLVDNRCALGATQAYTAVALDEGGEPIDGVTFAWGVDDETVAAIDAATGVATAVGNGSAMVTAIADGVTGVATLTVEQAVSSLTLDRTCVDVDPCEPLPSFSDQVQIVAEALDANGHAVASPAVTWSSGDTEVGTIDEAGLVTAVGNGATTILATSDGVSATIEVTVRQKTHSVIVEPSDFTLAVGEDTSDPATGPARAVAVVPSEQQLTATAYDANGNAIDDAAITWESLDPSVATVDETGLVSAVGSGTTKIRATSEGVSADATVTVE